MLCAQLQQPESSKRCPQSTLNWKGSRNVSAYVCFVAHAVVLFISCSAHVLGCVILCSYLVLDSVILLCYMVLFYVIWC